MADILVTSPFQPFTLPTQFKAVFNGYIYCGTVDAVDPSVSQVQVYLVNESGDKVPVAQPLRTNAGGYLVYNGQPAKFVTDSNHSLLVQDSFHVQVWYEADMANIDPAAVIGVVFDILDNPDGSSKIGFIQAGTGALPRTSENKMRERITLQDFGAVGNGVTDDTAAVQKAINASYGKSLWITGGGTYKVSGLIIANRLSIFGDHQTAILFDGSVINCLDVSNATIDGLAIRGVKMRSTSTSTMRAIYGVNCKITNARICDNDLEGFHQGISIVGGTTSKTYLQPYGLPYTTIGLDGRNIITGNYIHDTVAIKSGSSVGYAVYTQESGYWHIDGNRIENMQGSILSPMYGTVNNNIIINIFDDNGIYCAHSRGVQVTGNYIEGTLGDGIALNDAHFCNVTGNVVVAPGNSGIRLQQGNDLNITSNLIVGGPNTSSYMRGGVDAGSPNAPYNINISDNTFTGGTNNSTNPFAFGSPTMGTAYKNWVIANNKIDKVNTSALVSPFYGPHKIIHFGSAPVNVVIHDNVFNDVTECPRDSDGNYRYLTASREYNNLIVHAAGFTTVPSVDSIKLSGSVRFACGAAGVVTTPTYEGLVTSIVSTGTTGVYTVTLSRAMAIRDFAWSASGANAPFHIRMDVVNPGVTDEWTNSFNITMYTAAGTAVFPNFNSAVILHFKAYSGGLGVNV